MSDARAVEDGRTAFGRQEWTAAFDRLSAADRVEPLAPADLDRLATAAHLVGRDGESADVWARAYQAHVGLGEVRAAVRAAFWLGFVLSQHGEPARAGGWLARSRELLGDRAEECVEQAYLRLPGALMNLDTDPAAAYAGFTEVTNLAERFGDADLTTLGRLGRGQSLVRLGELTDAMALLDEAMVAVLAGEVSPMVSGIVYCAVIMACREIFDLRRAREWTAALGRWCEAQPDLVAYRGQCLVHRAEIMQLQGHWRESMVEARLAHERLSRPAGQPAVGLAYYQQAELHRLRGETAQAEEAYRQANQLGQSPQPGLALLRLADGKLAAADTAIRRELAESQGRLGRPKLLPVYVEIMLATGDLAAAKTGAADLATVATDLDSPYLRAASAYADGAVLLAEGNAAAALEALRAACRGWQQVQAPYDVARSRTLVGMACRELGDEDSAELEFDAARRVLQQLGAAPDLARLDALASRPASQPASGLTARELQVLALVATGRTNRAIAADLVISEKTVARHVSNIFTKLGLSSRAAATAYAYEHDLL